VIDAIESSGSHEHAREREHALLSLWGALYSAYAIGSHGTVSENTKAVGTPPVEARRQRSASRQLELMTKLITTAEKVYPPGGRGRVKAIDSFVA